MSGQTTGQIGFVHQDIVSTSLDQPLYCPCVLILSPVHRDPALGPSPPCAGIGPWGPLPSSPSPACRGQAPRPRTVPTRSCTSGSGPTLPCVPDGVCKHMVQRAPHGPMGSPTDWMVQHWGPDGACQSGLSTSEKEHCYLWYFTLYCHLVNVAAWKFFIKSTVIQSLMHELDPVPSKQVSRIWSPGCVIFVSVPAHSCKDFAWLDIP